MSEEKTKNNHDVSNENIDDFDVTILSKKDDTVIVTSNKDLSNREFLAISSYDPKNVNYSSYLNDGISPSKTLTFEEIDTLLTNTQNDLSKVLTINSYNRKLVNQNDIVGKTVESIETNINTEIKVTYGRAEEAKGKKRKLEEFKKLIDSVNEGINPKRITRNAVSTAYMEGNWIAYLRHENKDNYTVDFYPLGVCIITDTLYNGEPVVWMDIKELRKRLQKTYKKTKKKKPLMFANMEEEVKNSYPEEVYKAFIDKEDYAVLNPKYTGVIRINNINRKYGVSPITRAYRDLSMLDTFADTDRVNSKAKGKKIIHQKMRKETMGQDYKKDFYPEMAYAHQNFMSAWSQRTVVVTSPPTVEEIKYVEPSVEMTSKDTYNIYRSKALTTLGIQFLMDNGSQSVSTASISVTQLMRTINSITEQLEDIYKKWYRQIAIDNKYPIEYTPDVEVIDSEQLEFEMKKTLGEFCYNTLGASRETVFEMVGLDINDEVHKRLSEKEKKYDEIFTPYSTAYTKSGQSDDTTGRPADSKNEAKQQYDKTRQEGLK